MDRKYRLPFSLFFVSLLLISCGKNNLEQDAVASVNGVPISLEELQKEISVLSKRDPDFKITQEALDRQLNTIIDKKLLLQEARDKGLTEDERFVETIKTFWEQSLIRGLMELKMKEWGDRLFVTEDEVNKHYQRMQYAPLVRLAMAKERGEAEEIRGKMIKGEAVEGEKTAEPLFIEDIREDAFLNAFDMNAGEANIYESDGGYAVIHVVKKEKIQVPPLQDIYGRIKTFLLERKRQKAVEEWMRGVKKSARININTQLLKEVAHEQ